MLLLLQGSMGPPKQLRTSAFHDSSQQSKYTRKNSGRILILDAFVGRQDPHSVKRLHGIHTLPMCFLSALYESI